MANPPLNHDVECKTIDGTVISGRLYPVEGPAPAIIMSNGLTCWKEVLLPEIAEALQSLGYNVLLYDGRNIGASGGQPRNHVDGLQNAEDISDIYTWMAGVPSVDPQRIALWGISFGAIISAGCAAIDHRPHALVMVSPSFTFVPTHKLDQLRRQLIGDRVLQLWGNEPHYVQIVTPEGETAMSMAGTESPEAQEVYDVWTNPAVNPPPLVNRITLQSCQKLAMFRPQEYLDMIRVPVLMVTPELDGLSTLREQKQTFARLKCPKREYIARGKNHVNVATGEGLLEVVEISDQFLKAALHDGIV